MELAEGGYGRQARGGGQVPSSFQARQRAGRASGKIPCGGRGSGGKGAPGAETARDRVAVPAGAGRGPDEAISTGGITAPALRGAQDRRRRAVGGGGDLAAGERRNRASGANLPAFSHSLDPFQTFRAGI